MLFWAVISPTKLSNALHTPTKVHAPKKITDLGPIFWTRNTPKWQPKSYLGAYYDSKYCVSSVNNVWEQLEPHLIAESTPTSSDCHIFINTLSAYESPLMAQKRAIRRFLHSIVWQLCTPDAVTSLPSVLETLCCVQQRSKRLWDKNKCEKLVKNGLFSVFLSQNPVKILKSV